MSFGSRLKEARKTKKLTQVEVASRLGIDDTTISKYENDKSEPDNETLKKLATLYGCSIDYLMGKPKAAGDGKTEKHPAEKLREYIDMGMSNEEIKKRMDFVVDIFELTDEEIDETISFLRWRVAERKKQAAFSSKSHEL